MLQASIKVIENEEEASRFSIEQVVLPVPGLESIMPQNQLKAEYEAIFASDGIEITPALSRFHSLCPFAFLFFSALLSDSILVLWPWRNDTTESSTFPVPFDATWCVQSILNTKSSKLLTMTLDLIQTLLLLLPLLLLLLPKEH